MHHRRSSCMWLVVLVLTLALSGAVLAQNKPLVLKMGLISPADHPVTKASEYMAQLVKERTGGAIEIQVFPAGVLGGEVELQAAVRGGAVHMASIGDGQLASYSKPWNIFVMYYIWPDAETMHRIQAGPPFEPFIRDYEKNAGITVLAINWEQGTRHLLAKKPVRTPEDLRGVKIRVDQLPLHADGWRAMGANPTPLAFPEVYSALQQGVVDAMECPLNWIYTSGFHEHAKYLNLTAHSRYMNTVIINTKLYEGLSPEYQQILREAAVEAGVYETELSRQEEQHYRELMEKEGVTFVEADVEAFRARILPLFEQHMDKWGQEVYDVIMQ
ncbi:MAG: TRAP transporter substrate-binding protein [Limnochordia bacterium]|jgi:tripartite ATP-independent transporter DctP family solute receptor|nr:TRAP transporter substrate-binding protein [Bacillota bacterium]